MDENYIGDTSALKQAENILKKAIHQSRPRKISTSNSPKAPNEFSPESLKQKSNEKSSYNKRSNRSTLYRMGSPKRYSMQSNESVNISEIQFNKTIKFQKQDFSQLEAIIEKDFEAIDEFKTKWNRYANLVQDALTDRK